MSRHKNSLACYACDLGASVSVPFTQKSKVFDQKYNQYSDTQEKQMSRPMDYCYWGRKTKLGLDSGRNSAHFAVSVRMLVAVDAVGEDDETSSAVQTP